MTRLVWGIKKSLRQYIECIPDGKIEASEGAAVTEDGLFSFPTADMDARDEEGFLRFRGTVLLSGYRGMMNVALCDPGLKFTAEGATLSVDRPHRPGSRVILAVSETFRTTTAEVNGATVVDGLELTSAGAQIFEFNYPLGAPLDSAQVF